MKKRLSLFMAMLMILSLFSICVYAQEPVRYNAGDKIVYGSYPQSRVVYPDKIAELDGTEKNEWTALNSKSEYSDMDIDGDGWYDYRAVKNIHSTEQQTESVKINYYAFEPLSWIVLDSQEGLVMSETVIDALPYNNSYYIPGIHSATYRDTDCICLANNYYESDIRHWLNNDFVSAAFSKTQADNIRIDRVDNSVNSGAPEGYECQDSFDKVFLMSQSEFDSYITFTYNIAKESDYAVKRGTLYRMWLRTPNTTAGGLTTDCLLKWYENGESFYYRWAYNSIDYCEGIRPLCKLDEIRNDSPRGCKHKNTYTEGYVAETCFSDGVSGDVYCLDCGVLLSKSHVTEQLTHDFVNVAQTAPTCVAVGYTEGEICSLCGEVKSGREVIPMTEHNYQWVITTQATQEHSGLSEYKCTVCGDVTESQKIRRLETREIIEFGSYPKTLVTDESLINALNSLNAEFIPCGIDAGYYFQGDKDPEIRNNYMKYADVTYGGEKYRGVIAYKDIHWLAGSAMDNEFTRGGYRINEVHWFKYEPIQWITLDANRGLYMAKDVIANSNFNEAYGGVYFNKDYEHTAIRNWLITTFYNQAFSASEKNQMTQQHLDIDFEGEADYMYTAEGRDYFYYGEPIRDVDDKVFLASYSDIHNPDYGFIDDDSRMAEPTDYARMMFALNSHFSYFVRTPGPDYHNQDSTHSYYTVKPDGSMFSPFYTYEQHDAGIRPVIRIHTHTDGNADGVCDSCADELASSHEEAPQTFIERIKAFFDRILDFFRNLFR